MAQPNPTSCPILKPKLGRLYCGQTEQVLSGKPREALHGHVNLIVTSPPFPLNQKKKYSNLLGDEYLNWLSRFGPLFSDLLADDGSLVIEIGNAWEPKRPIQSLLPRPLPRDHLLQPGPPTVARPVGDGKTRTAQGRHDEGLVDGEI